MKQCRKHLRQSGEDNIIVDNEKWWKQWIAHHASAHKICIKPIISSVVARVLDEHDYNHDFDVVDFILTYSDGSQARLHPNKQNPNRVRFGRYSDQLSRGANPTLSLGFACWVEASAASADVGSTEARQPNWGDVCWAPIDEGFLSEGEILDSCEAVSARPPDVHTELRDHLAHTPVEDMPPPLQEEWSIYFDKESGKPWWYCQATGQSQWAVPCGWALYKDPPSGRTYAFHEGKELVYFLS